MCDFEVNNDKYMAFIRLANSYNRTSRLKIVIGFCRWICLNGCIFGERSFTLSVTHDDKRLRDANFLQETADRALETVGDLATAQKEFRDALKPLPEISMTPKQMRSLFCLVNEISLDESSARSLAPKRREHLIEINTRLDKLISAYSNEFGTTAYAAYNVLTDYASYPSAGALHPTNTPGYQRCVGTWLRDFSHLVPNLDLTEYLSPYDKTQSILSNLDAPSTQAEA